jgi:ABC-type antimicrobial peptide transport system permease subunit
MYLSFKYSSIQTILIIASGIFIINQFYHIMRSSSKDYIIIKALGATKNQIRSLIFIQAVLLFLFTVPLGICIGMTASDFILNSLSEFAVHKLKLLDSSIIILFISGMISCAIIVIGILLEIGSRRKRPFQISS